MDINLPKISHLIDSPRSLVVCKGQDPVYLVYTSLFIVELLDPEFWVLENPVGRIQKLVPELGEKRLVFQPWEYGDPWSKKTCLWGKFNNKLEKTPVDPIQGSMAYRTSSRNKNKRTQTPPGFAKAFFEANKKGCL